jgi:DNA helicase-2/ATP-dependent DNA helicase PcrA
MMTSVIVNEDAVHLMTCHSSKDWNRMYLFRCKDKKWGNKTNRDKIKLPFGLVNQVYADELDEERRLFFVALSRARRQATISYSMHNAKQRQIQPSIFISELPQDKIDRIKTEQNLEKRSAIVQQVFTQVSEEFDLKNYLKPLLLTLPSLQPI